MSQASLGWPENPFKPGWKLFQKNAFVFGAGWFGRLKSLFVRLLSLVLSFQGKDSMMYMYLHSPVFPPSSIILSTVKIPQETSLLYQKVWGLPALVDENENGGDKTPSCHHFFADLLLLSAISTWAKYQLTTISAAPAIAFGLWRAIWQLDVNPVLVGWRHFRRKIIQACLVTQWP